MKFKQVINEIKLLNPLLWAEKEDAIRWNKTCKQRLIEGYENYLESEKRLKKITNKIQAFQ